MGHNIQVIKFNAGNDTNGNPRRLFAVMRAGDVVIAIDEGYSGSAALADALPRSGAYLASLVGVTFATTPKQYRELLKEFGFNRAVKGDKLFLERMKREERDIELAKALRIKKNERKAS